MDDLVNTYRKMFVSACSQITLNHKSLFLSNILCFDHELEFLNVHKQIVIFQTRVMLCMWSDI